jgi:chitodextrinase
VSATTQAGADTSAPTPPPTINIALVTSTQVNLVWTASTDNVGVTGYEVYRNNTKVATVTSLTYSNTGLTPFTAYTFYVKARDAAGNVSAASSTVSTTTSAAPDSTAPSVPANPVATAVSSTQINLGWSASTDNVAVSSYEVYRDNVKVATVTTTSYGDATRSPSSTYYYYVKARDTAGNVSAASVTVSATTFAQVSVTGSIHGTITSSSGTPVYLAKIVVIKDGVNRSKKTYYTDSFGAFSIQNLAPGTYKLTYSAKSHISQNETVVIDSTTTDISKNIILQRR